MASCGRKCSFAMKRDSSGKVQSTSKRRKKQCQAISPEKNCRSLLICSNANGDCEIKSLLVYHSENSKVFQKDNVHKNKLP